MNNNLLAILCLKKITEILTGIETNDANYIEFSLGELKKNILEFERVFKKNKASGVYNSHNAI